MRGHVAGKGHHSGQAPKVQGLLLVLSIRSFFLFYIYTWLFVGLYVIKPIFVCALIPCLCFPNISANPKSRPSPQQFLQRAESYFQNDLVYACEFLAELTLQDEGKKATFFSKLPEMMDSFPKATCLKKIFPQLLNAFNFGGAGTAILAPMFKIGNLMTAEEYQVSN